MQNPTEILVFPSSIGAMSEIAAFAMYSESLWKRACPASSTYPCSAPSYSFLKKNVLIVCKTIWVSTNRSAKRIKPPPKPDPEPQASSEAALASDLVVPQASFLASFLG